MTYDDLDAHSGEIFGSLTHVPTGFFLKGYAGLGGAKDGELIDEDFPPLTNPYSRTVSGQDDGDLTYFSADLGWFLYDTRRHHPNFLALPAVRLGGFVGYHRLDEEFHAFGCTQVATNPFICRPGAVSPGTAVISQDSEWESWRLGLIGEAQLSERFLLSAEAAYVKTELDAADTHHLRIGAPTGLPPLNGSRAKVTLDRKEERNGAQEAYG